MRKQEWSIGSSNPITQVPGDAGANAAFTRFQILKASALNGMFAKDSAQLKIVSDEICNLLDAYGVIPDPQDSTQLYTTINKVLEEIKTSSLQFKGYVSTTEPSQSTYILVPGNMWINSAVMPTTFPVPASDIKVWNGTDWEDATEDYTPGNFHAFRDIENGNGYYWFGGEWKELSTDMDPNYFTLNQSSGLWEIAPDVDLPGTPTVQVIPPDDDNSDKIATTAWVLRNTVSKSDAAIDINIIDILNAKPAGAKLYGFYIDENEIETAGLGVNIGVHYVLGCDNAYYTPASMDFSADVFRWGTWESAFFIGKPCMLKRDGTVDYYLDPNDYTKKTDGTDSDVANLSYDGNAMVEFPKIFMKQMRIGARNYCLISDMKIEGFECYPCLREDGTYNDHFYLPCYEGYNDNGVMRSMSRNAKCTGSTTRAQEMQYCRANGAGWDMTTWADENTMMMLYYMMFKNTNSQHCLGYGGTYSDSALTVNQNACDKKGLFYGTEADSSFGMKFMGLHNWWGHRWRFCLGCLTSNTKYYVKMTKHRGDGSTTDDYSATSVEGYKLVEGVSYPSAFGSYIKGYNYSENGALMNKIGGASTTFYCDGSWTNIDAGPFVHQLGGAVDNGAFGGVSCFAVNTTATHANWGHGASLSYHTP